MVCVMGAGAAFVAGVGHVPSDVMSAHYEAFTVDRFRREIVGKVEAFRQKPALLA